MPVLRSLRPVYLAGLLGTAAALAAAVAHAGPPQAIYGGGQVAPCAWPTTVSLGGCTGTLVHPELVVSAAHCMDGGGPASIVFGDRDDQPALEVATTDCEVDPQYGAAGGHDIAYCRLAKPVTSVPIVPILMGCETDVLTPGVSVIAVGFGEANDNLGWGPKRQVAMPLNGITNGEAFIGGNGKDTCYGDSGGSVFVKLADGTWRVFGVTSYGEYCGAGGYYSMMHTAIDWLEQSSGLDLTPCFDHGVWEPGPSCGGFPLDPDVGGGSWSNGCASGKVSGPSASCGAAGGGGSGGGAGEPGTAGAGAAESGGQPSTPPTSGPPGCSVEPDCASCATCVEQCRCTTGETAGCVQACAPTNEPSAPPQAPGAAPRATDHADVVGSCATGRAGDWPAAWLVVLGAIALGLIRRHLGLLAREGGFDDAVRSHVRPCRERSPVRPRH